MRIARYIADGRETVGIVRGDRLVAIDEPDVVGVLEAGPQAWRSIERGAEGHDGIAVAEADLLAPLAKPSKFLAVGMNSADHVQEAQTATRTPEVLEMLRASSHLEQAFPEPRFPVTFNKQTNSIAGPRQPIWIPRDSTKVDYEGEAVIVIGRRVRRADDAEAGEAIAGWTVTNDVSVRDWQWNTSQIWLGKSFDTHGPIGPWIVTSDEFDPAQAVIRTWVNGELRQEGALADQLLAPARIVSLLSQVCTLEPGDLIATGTPCGVGTATGRYLVQGDRVRIEVTGIGEIENEVIDEPTVAASSAVAA